VNILAKVKRRIRRAATSNPVVNGYFSAKRRQWLTAEFLQSSKYDRLFLRHVANAAEFHEFQNDAEAKTPNYNFRHGLIARGLGSWRWKGMYLHRHRLIPILMNHNLRGIDIGGAAGPVSMEATVVDFSERDVFGRRVQFQTLDQLDFSPDYIFSSHTLEHVKDVEQLLKQMRDASHKDSSIVLHLPAWTCTRWRAGEHTHRNYGNHLWTFYLTTQKPTMSLNNMIAVDELVSNHFRIDFAEHVGDDSILILAHPK
jgi:hypothetical protein